MSEDETPPVASTSPVEAPPPVVGVRQLIGTSFDLLLRAGEPMRRASFYVGIVVLGTIGPLVLAVWGTFVVGYPFEVFGGPVLDAAEGWYLLLAFLMVVGVFVATIESQAIVIALLGSHHAGRPISVAQAVQRARMVSWPVFVAALVVSVPTTLAQNALGQETQQALLAGLVIGIAVQVPFVYASAGIVLGGVGPLEALRRSTRIARARKVAAVVLAILPSAFALLVVAAMEAGLDLTVRSVEALGLGTDSGPMGIAILTILIVMVVFALGTLLLTAAGIIYAPQVVMFVGLTHATIGLDPVRPGGDHAPGRHALGRRPFRWLTRPMLLAFLIGGVGLAGFLATISG